MENRKRLIELLETVRYTTNDIEKVADEICYLFDVSKSFSSLIDRLEIASNIKYPNRPYTPDFRKSVALMWKGKESELLMQVKKLEKEVNVC
mgnify:CR=1 FL=1|tara:strand:- start:335 stop:610 length:276 start_codon:yes stop_codon:yes gene_type:complete